MYIFMFPVDLIWVGVVSCYTHIHYRIDIPDTLDRFTVDWIAQHLYTLGNSMRAKGKGKVVPSPDLPKSFPGM